MLIAMDETIDGRKMQLKQVCEFCGRAVGMSQTSHVSKCRHCGNFNNQIFTRKVRKYDYGEKVNGRPDIRSTKANSMFSGSAK